MDDVRPPLRAGAPRFTDELRRSIRARGLSYATEKTYLYWVLRFIRFHGRRHPELMGAAEVAAFLTHLAEAERCAANTQRTALNALVFLYRHHLKKELGDLAFRYARRQRRMPTVFTHDEAMRVIAQLPDDLRLIGELMYGAGLRVSEALRLRIKDLDFGALQITVRDGKGLGERLTLLPRSAVSRLEVQIATVERLHAYDLERGYGAVHLPDALARKYPGAATRIDWQFVFPAAQLSRDPYDGTLRRHHRHYASVQRAVHEALGRSGFRRKAGSHTFRHSFATRLIETCYDIKLVQSLLGHRDIRTTEIYLHVVRNRSSAIVSPVDRAP